MDSPLILPICTVQPDFDVSVRDVDEGLVPEEKFWLSWYKSGEESVHGQVSVTLNESDRNLLEYNGLKGVSFKAGAEANTYFAACEGRGIPFTKVVVPDRTFSDPLPQSSKGVFQKIAAFDIAPDGSQFATGYDDGSVYLISTSSPSAHSIARKTHLSTLTSLRFFPSSRVLLTSSTDFSLSILPADPPTSSSSSSLEPTRISPVRTLKGHTRAVTSTAIIARGRTILSASKDATVRLWDVSSGTQIRSMGTKNYTSINAISAGEKAEGVFTTPPPDGVPGSPPPQSAVDPREVETADKVVYAALSDGSFEVFDLNTKLSVYRHPKATSSLESIAYSPAHSLLATGSLRGVVTVYDTRSLGTPLTSFKRNEASVEDIAFVSGGNSGDVGLAIATSDGLPYVANVRPEGPSVRAELIGTDCDGVRSVKVGSEGAIWTAGDDGIVRRYSGVSGS